MSMRSWSIPVGRLFGIEIRIHLTFLFLLVFVWSTEAATQDADCRAARARAWSASFLAA